MNWPAQSHYNRLQWQAIGQAIAKQMADAACHKALAAPQAKRGAAAPLSGFAAFMESLILSTLPAGNHGEIYAKGRSA